MFSQWIDIRKMFIDHFGPVKPPRLLNMLQHFNMKFQGNPHSGLDDSQNIALLAIELMKQKIVMEVNATQEIEPVF